MSRLDELRRKKAESGVSWAPPTPRETVAIEPLAKPETEPMARPAQPAVEAVPARVATPKARPTSSEPRLLPAGDPRLQDVDPAEGNDFMGWRLPMLRRQQVKYEAADLRGNPNEVVDRALGQYFRQKYGAAD